MVVEKIHDKGQTLAPPTGKLVGIVDTRADFDKASRELQAAGFKKLEVLSGDEGISLLERIHTFFFSDMEDRVLARHIEELKAGHLVMLIEAPSDQVDEATRVATKNGVRGLVHFGLMTVTWMTK